MSQKGYSSFYRPPAKGLQEPKLERLSFMDLTDESVCESQNFKLMVSQGSSIEEFTASAKSSTAKNNDDDEIIILSDSSSSPSSKNLRKPMQKEGSTNNQVLILDSSISAISSSDDETFFQDWRSNQNHKVQGKLQGSNKNNVRESKLLITSDETSSSASENRRKIRLRNTSDSSWTHISPTQETTDNTDNMIKNFTKLGNGQLGNTKLSSNDSTNTEPIKQLNTPVREVAQSTRPISSSSRKLTKKELSSILKTIKSSKIVYESPRRHDKDHVIIDETLDDVLHPAFTPTEKIKTRPVIINETPPNSRNDVTNVPKEQEALIEDQSVEPAVYQHTGLSSRKTKQIAEWLMSNSPDSRSDSSFSCVPPSNRSSINSGNSSLERLELNYETPNNRGKVQKPANKDKSIGSTKENTPRLSTKKDNLLRKVHDNDGQNSNMLNTLRENTWRTRINTAQPASEPRRNQNLAKDRGIQTERKNTSKQKKNWIIDSHEDDSDSSLHDIRPEIHSKSSIVKRTKKKNNSFLDDNSSSSESEKDSLYYTALTNPRPSRNTAPKPTPQSALVKRALALCDSETDEDQPKEGGVYETDLGRRRLEFSDDDDNDDVKSSTSEFDPGDDIPPKPVSKKETKTPRQPTKAKSNNKILPSVKSVSSGIKSKQSFLASLSETVPLTCAHPDAKKYRSNFKNTKDELSKYLFKLYNEKVFDNQLPHDMSMEWNVRMRGTAGYCYNKKSVKTLGGIVRSSRIVLATKILDTPDRLRDTLIHEMCHAAAWLINEVSDGHGPFWTAWAGKAMKTFPELPPIRRCHDYEIKTKFTYKCTSCGYSIGRHSKSLDVERKRCGHCYGKFELLVNKHTKSGTVQVQTPKREPSAFALFVKENYHSVKKERNVKHAEIMKILSAQFSAVKIAKKNDNDKENCLDACI